MMTKTLAANGAKKIYIIGRRAEKLDEAASLAPSVIIPIQGDVTSKSDLSRISSQIQSQEGYIDLLICNSGMLGPNVSVPPGGEVEIDEYASKAFEMDMASFNQTMNVNVAAVLWTAYAFLGLLGKGNEKKNYLAGQVKSQIIVTASIAAYNKLPNTGLALVFSLLLVIITVHYSSSFFLCFAHTEGCK